MRNGLTKLALAAFLATGAAAAPQAAEFDAEQTSSIRVEWSQPNVDITYGTVANTVGGAMARIEGGGDDRRIVYQGVTEMQTPMVATIVGADGDGSPVVRYSSPSAPSMLSAIPATAHQQC